MLTVEGSLSTAPGMHLILFAHPRSGSSSLYQILQLYPTLQILEEPFNENFTRWQANNKNYRELVHDIPSLDAQLYLRPEAVKLNSAATYALLSNAHDIQQHCGNDVTGWLFET